MVVGGDVCYFWCVWYGQVVVVGQKFEVVLLEMLLQFCCFVGVVLSLVVGQFGGRCGGIGGNIGECCCFGDWVEFFFVGIIDCVKVLGGIGFGS